MMKPGRDRLDGTIDQAARQLVNGTMPPSLVSSVLAAVIDRAPQRPATGRRIAAAAATLILAAAIYPYLRHPSQRRLPEATTQTASRMPPQQIGDAGESATVISRRLPDRAGTIDRGTLPKPVTVALISVAPVTMPVVEMESFGVDPVEVVRVEVRPVDFPSQEGIR